MRPDLVALSVCALTFASSCKSTRGGGAPTPDSKPAIAASTPPAKPADKERPGVFVPASFKAVSIWPEAYSGELLVTEVMPQGALVKEGDVIARIETRSIDEQIHQAELEARSAAIHQAGVVERNKIDDEAAASALALARASLERARRSLEGWTKHEVPFARRSDEIGKKYEDAGIDDQKDELAQLEKMYSADELVDATEEIVLKRARRRLGISDESRGLSVDRRQYNVEYDEAMQTEVKQEGVRTQEQNLDRLARGQGIDRRAREDALARSTDALAQQNLKLERLKRDRELLAIKAPRSGVLLHGKDKDYRPGRTPARYERGSQLSTRSDLFVVADPDSFAVAVDVPESMLKELRDGTEVAVQPVAMPDESGPGALHLESYPSAKGGSGDENGYEATVKLEHAIPGVLFGMRAKVKFAAATKVAAPGAAKAGP
jgi:HlyD family secretion protein